MPHSPAYALGARAAAHRYGLDKIALGPSVGGKAVKTLSVTPRAAAGATKVHAPKVPGVSGVTAPPIAAPRDVTTTGIGAIPMSEHAMGTSNAAAARTPKGGSDELPQAATKLAGVLGLMAKVPALGKSVASAGAKGAAAMGGKKGLAVAAGGTVLSGGAAAAGRAM